MAPPVDGRDIALTHLLAEILRELEIWPRLPADELSVIRQARVMDRCSAYVLAFDQAETAKPVLGYIVANHLIRRASWEALADVSGVEVVTEAEVCAVAVEPERARIGLADGRQLEARLVVAADGRFSETRRRLGILARARDFGRVCIVCRMEHERPHGDVAWECFHYDRTLAVLPHAGNHASIVITLPAAEAEGVLAMPAAAFARGVERRFQSRLGAMRLVGARYPYPLVAVYADRFHGPRAALVGDAAVGMHPVTAHGYNLGLQGAHRLASEIAHAHARGRDIAAPAVLARYHRAHHRIARPLYLGTNAIVGLYSDEGPLARLVRPAMLRLGNHVHPARRVILSKLTEIRRPLQLCHGKVFG